MRRERSAVLRPHFERSHLVLGGICRQSVRLSRPASIYRQQCCQLRAYQPREAISRAEGSATFGDWGRHIFFAEHLPARWKYEYGLPSRLSPPVPAATTTAPTTKENISASPTYAHSTTAVPSGHTGGTNAAAGDVEERRINQHADATCECAEKLISRQSER